MNDSQTRVHLITRWRTLVPTLALVALGTLSATLSKGHIPQKAVLVRRVNLLYEAYRSRDQKAFKDLIHPHLLECIANLHSGFFDSWNSVEHLEIVSWEVRSIQAREDLSKQPLESCKGQPLHGDATALVFIGQSDRKKSEEPTTSVVAKFWVHVDGTWFWLPPLE